MRTSIFLLVMSIAAVVVAAENKKASKAASKRTAKITSNSTYYDRKNGYAVFDGKVAVDDGQYQLHADKAYIFFGATNDLSRIVAVGHVALTNEMRRAYGAQATYRKQNGMVILYGGKTQAAEVHDLSKSEDQVVRGSKIKFWIDSEQVEVINADITAPVNGAGDIKSVINR